MSLQVPRPWSFCGGMACPSVVHRLAHVSIPAARAYMTVPCRISNWQFEMRHLTVAYHLLYEPGSDALQLMTRCTGTQGVYGEIIP